MEALWTSVVAVTGTLLGSVLTFLFQRQASRREEEFRRTEALREQRVAVYSAFAVALEDYRHGQASRWHRWAEHGEGEAFTTARDEAHRLRTAARHALYRVSLLTTDGAVTEAAEHAYRCVWEVSHARDQTGHEQHDRRAREAIEGFVASAAPLVR